MNKQSGFVLVSVLVITSITTLLAFSQINNNRLQERIGGNQQKELNARLAAEKGMFSAFEYIAAQNQAGTANADILTGLQAWSFSGENYTFESIDLSGDIFTLLARGDYFGAHAYLKTEIQATEASGIFDDAIITCDGVTLGGNSQIDSYSGGPYSNSTTKENGNVAAITGDIDLTGSAQIKGNATAAGHISDPTKVTGTSVSSYGGNMGVCDPLDIVNNMPTYASIPLSFDAAKKSTTNFAGGTVAGVTPTSMELLGETETVYIFDDFTSDDNNNVITVDGDITLYIQGDLTIKNTTFTLQNSSSSLTIFLEGNMVVNTGSEVFSGEYAKGDHVPLTVYSANSDATPISLGGNGEIYMNLYAPYESVSYNGNAAILGALRGNEVDLSGTGDIHYDEGLGDLGGTTDDASVKYTSIYYHYE